MTALAFMSLATAAFVAATVVFAIYDRAKHRRWIDEREQHPSNPP